MVVLGKVAVSLERDTPVGLHGKAYASTGRFRDVPYRGTSLIRNSPPPQDRRRSLGMVLR